MATKPANHKIRSTKFYEDAGWIVGAVETKRMQVRPPAATMQIERGTMLVKFFGTNDLFGFADLVLWDKDGNSACCQYTSSNNHGTRRAKILSNMTALDLMKRGVPIHVLSWGRAAGKRVYIPRLEILL